MKNPVERRIRLEMLAILMIGYAVNCTVVILFNKYDSFGQQFHIDAILGMLQLGLFTALTALVGFTLTQQANLRRLCVAMYMVPATGMFIMTMITLYFYQKTLSNATEVWLAICILSFALNLEAGVIWRAANLTLKTPRVN